MTEAKHTPGPWKWHPTPSQDVINNAKEKGYAHNPGHILLNDAHGLPESAILMMSTQARTHMTESNAYLIAAAPDLLAACRTAHDALLLWRHGHSFPKTDMNVAFDTLVAAIAAAEKGTT